MHRTNQLIGWGLVKIGPTQKKIKIHSLKINNRINTVIRIWTVRRKFLKWNLLSIWALITMCRMWLSLRWVMKINNIFKILIRNKLINSIILILLIQGRFPPLSWWCKLNKKELLPKTMWMFNSQKSIIKISIKINSKIDRTYISNLIRMRGSTMTKSTHRTTWSPRLFWSIARTYHHFKMVMTGTLHLLLSTNRTRLKVQLKVALKEDFRMILVYQWQFR